MAGPDAVDVLLRPAPDERARPGRAFLGDDELLLAPARHGPVIRSLAGIEVLFPFLVEIPCVRGFVEPIYQVLFVVS